MSVSHLHQEDMESFYVLEGEITLYIAPGDHAALPARRAPAIRVERRTADPQTAQERGIEFVGQLPDGE